MWQPRLYRRVAVTVTVRVARAGDGDEIARAWLSAAAYYTDLAPEYFQVPSATGLAELFDTGIGRGGDVVLQLVAELDGCVVGWLSARVEQPGGDAAAELIREHG